MENLIKLNELFNSESTGIAIINISDLGAFFYKMNDTLKGYFGYEEDELNKLTLQDISHPEDLAMTLEKGFRILNKEIDQFTYEKRYIRKDETQFWGLTSVSRISDTYLLFVIQDISAYKNIKLDIHNIVEPLTNDNINEYCQHIKHERIQYRDKFQRRNYFRFSLPKPICTQVNLRQTINGVMTSFSPATVCIQNISGGGLCFHSKIELPTEDDFQTYFEFSLLGTKLGLIGKIVRHRKLPLTHEYGVEFKISESDRENLIRTLHNLTILVRNRIKIYDTDFCTKKCEK